MSKKKKKIYKRKIRYPYPELEPNYERIKAEKAIKKLNAKKNNKVKVTNSKKPKKLKTVLIKKNQCPFCNGKLNLSTVLCPDDVKLHCFECKVCHVYLYDKHDSEVLQKIAQAYNKKLDHNKVFIADEVHKVIIVKNEKDSKISSQKQKKETVTPVKVPDVIPENITQNRINKKLYLTTANPLFFLSINDYYYASRLKNKLVLLRKKYDKIEIEYLSGKVINSNDGVALCEKYINDSFFIFGELYEDYLMNQLDDGLEFFSIRNNIVINNYWYEQLYLVSRSQTFLKHKSKECFYSLLMDKLAYLLEKEHFRISVYNCSSDVEKIVQANKICHKKEEVNDANTLDWTKESPTVYIYNGFINGFVRNNPVYDYGANVKIIGSDKIVRIVVTYCPEQNKYYIPYQLVKEFIEKQISLSLTMKHVDDFSSSFKEFSTLSLYGYTVKQDGISESKRRDILRFIIENKIMSAGEIISHLNGLIELRSNRIDRDFSKAIRRWSDDIDFVNDYAIKRGLPVVSFIL